MEQVEKTLDKPAEFFRRENIEEIATMYNLPSLRFITVPNAGLTTENAVLESEDGHRYFAKCYGNDDFTAQAGFYRAAELVAINQEIPVSLPLPNNGAGYTISVEGRSLALFPYVAHREQPAQTLEEELKLLTDVGMQLGRIHSTPIPDDELLLKPILRWNVENYGIKNSQLNKIIAHIEALPSRSEYDERALVFAKTKLELLQKVPLVTPVRGNSAICHGDYHLHNVLRDNNMNVVSIIDWDNSGIADPNCDYVNSFFSFVIGRVTSSFETERLVQGKAFSSGYQTGLGKAIDIQQLRSSYAVLMNERIKTAWPVYQHYFENQTKNDDRVDIVLKRAELGVEQYDQLYDFIVKTL